MYTRLCVTAVFFLLGGVLQGCSSTPPYQGLDGDALFELGAREFQEEDWDEAIRVFERFLFADPGHERIVEARMYLARAYFNREDYITLASEFSRILDRHPGNPLAPDAAWGVCRSYVALSPHIQRDQGYTVQAVSACDNVVQDFGSFEVAVEAEALRGQMREKLARKTLIAGEFYYRRKLYDSGIIYFNDVLTSYPGTDSAAQALLRLHQSYTEIGWDREAAEARERLLREFPDSEEAEEVRANGGGGGDGGKIEENAAAVEDSGADRRQGEAGVRQLGSTASGRSL
ncbi:MAG: outer membrane protein assembly factor BamD [Gemmatimonadota bacterium]